MATFRQLMGFVLFGYSVISIFGGQDVAPRPASTNEIQQLFDLAIFKPKRIRMVAEITLQEPAWTKGQVAAEMDLQNRIMAYAEQKLSEKTRKDLQNSQSNAIARSHSGYKVLRVQEWYSGKRYRLDQTDESSMASVFFRTNANVYRDTSANINDTELSPYVSFSADHELRSALLSKDPKMIYAAHDLWRALGLNEQVASPIVVALVDLGSVNPKQKKTDSDYSYVRIDPLKMKALHDGTDPIWHLQATDEMLNGLAVVHLKLEGKFFEMEMEKPDLVPVQMNYWIGQQSGRTVCVQTSFTNSVGHSSFISKREGFFGAGLPKKWETSTQSHGVKKEFNVVFKEIDLAADFLDTKIFSTRFPSDYIVSDITSGSGVILQNPHPEIGLADPPAGKSNKRRALLAAMVFVAVAPLVIVLFRRATSSTQSK